MDRTHDADPRPDDEGGRRATMRIGRVDEVDGTYVVTRFIGPLPAGSFYVATGTSLRATLGGSNELRIQTQWRSVALAYTRVVLPFIALALLGSGLATGGVTAPAWVASAVLLALSGASFFVGRRPEHERARLRLLGTITGLKIEPAKLQPATRERKRASLAVLMEKGGIPLGPDEILFVLEDIPAPALPLVFAYASYAGDGPEWRDCAERVFQRHEIGDV
jgi:hypothetical protein